MEFKNIGINPQVQQGLSEMVMRKKLSGQKTTIKEEAEKAINKHVKLELKKLGVTE